MATFKDLETLNFKNSNPGAVQFGNFINYYQFHPPENRVSLLPTDVWTLPSTNNSYTVLDLGCNAGDLTFALYTFLTKTVGITECSILGIDIDPTLIKRASERNILENCTFKCMDIMDESCRQQDIIKDYLNLHKCSKFEVVFCFSITMWIHLNHGDDGLKNFLKKVSEITNLLVIEPQPWKCYKSAVKRLKSTNSDFPKFSELKIRQNIEEEIENFIVEHCRLVKIKESVRTKWDRKLLFFKWIEK